MGKLFTVFAGLCFCLLTYAQESPVRGTWVTNVASEALNSRENIKKVVDQSKAAGLNHLFVVVWNRGVTIYPSKVLKKYIGVKQDDHYPGRDPLQEMIEEAHKQGIKVHAWFEFGFSYGYKDTSSTWFKRYPEWLGRNNKGELLQKNGFYWWNALHPGPKRLMRELVLEVVKRYDIDGVQGDDRLPAMPAEGGFDVYTAALYKSEKQLGLPFDNPKDEAFLQWKADKLSLFCKSLYEAVKHQRAGCIVSWAPSIYPWSKEQYLQDWPTWLKGGYADFVIPQLYRYKLADYEKILKALSTQVPPNLLKKVYPGILTSLGDGYQASPDMMKQMISLNRKYGFEGEVFFYYETLNKVPSFKID
jgi:uncharacterized lipoprotein YddW (UPF0748 family)